MDNLNNPNNLENEKEVVSEEYNSSNEKEKKDEKKIIFYFPYLLIFTILMFFSVFGITYSVYKGDLDDNEINTDQILFTYTDVDKVGNGIYLKNAVGIPDKLGKMMVGSKQYFDFFVTATTNKRNIMYYVLVNKEDKSTLQNENVRIYLTELMGSREKEVVLEDFSDLKTKKLNGKTYYVLYKKKLVHPLENHTDSYRLRMWVKEDAKNYENRNFSVKIDVYAEQAEE